jgi:hypothetical protein
VRERSDETYAAKYISISHPKAGIPMLDSSSDVAIHPRHADLRIVKLNSHIRSAIPELTSRAGGYPCIADS